MKQLEIRLGSLSDLIAALGGNVGVTFACALKKAAGLGGVRKFDVDTVVRFAKNNPRFKVQDAYPRKKKPATDVEPAEGKPTTKGTV